jgi:hypothetical protein
MADEKRTTPGSRDSARDSSGDGARRRRPAPTIDLTATEVGAPGALPKAAGVAPAQDAPRASAPGAATRPSAAGKMSHIAAGLGGGAIAATVLLAAWLIVPTRQDGASAVSARADALEKQIHDLANRPAVAADAKEANDLKDRLGKIEQSIAKTPAGDPGTAERLAGLENAMKAMGIALAALNHRAEDIAANVAAMSKSAADSDALQKRIDALESAAKVTQDKVAQNAVVDSAARLALAAVALRDAMARGEPFAPQLAAATSLGADPKLLVALEPFAAIGVPSEAALARELTALLPTMLEASGANASASGGFIERLQANAGKLVRIRPADAPPGDDASAVMARLEVKAARHDMTGVQVDIAKLPAKARALAETWIKRADARTAAFVAVDALVADATRAIGKSP